MAGLRLDTKDAAMEVRKNGAAIVPGKPEASLLYQRVSATDAKRRMPPEYSHKSLTERQVSLLKQWIAQGASWKEQWAFRAPVKPQLPVVQNAAWAKGPIDRLVLQQLQAKGLSPAPPADRRTLLRRVALDLTGLPPTPAEIDLYMKDLSPAAYEHMVDRYLASPRYGEHRARYWLDAARYGDTHGIHIDNYRDIWPYRDWVIAAYNRNLPFNQFSIEQLAGDLLPDPTLDQRIATGFVRCGVTTNEAGIIEDEYAEIYAKDRADTVAAVWLGMTAGCATCHDHKFDPISQKDFYGLGAFFRNTTQKVMDGNISDPPPVIFVPAASDRAKWSTTSKRLQQIRDAMDAAIKATAPAIEQVSITHPLDVKDELFAASLTFPGKDGASIAKSPKLDATEPFSMSVGFLLPAQDKSYVIAAQQNAKEKNRGWAIDVSGRTLGIRLTGDNGRTIEVRGTPGQLNYGAWNHAVITYDGSRKQSGLYLYLNGHSMPPEARANLTAEVPGDIGMDLPLILGKSLADGAISDFRILNRVVTESEARLLSEWTALQGGDRAALADHDLFHNNDAFRALVKEQNDLTTDLRAMERRGAVTLILQERAGTTPSAHILYRGAYDQQRDLVLANTPSVLPPMTAAMPRNRLGFAQWLFTDDHPLTARVTVNRMWQEIFGAGIVKTVDDFGSQGEPPANQALLDWLAVDFREGGWDVKRFYRQVLLSATYRQSAASTPEKLAKDPDNRLFSRGPRFRLDGETVRDYALAASGLLAQQIGGPSVKPYQPEGVWEAVAMDGSNTRFYKQDAGDGLYRRSLYTFWKRSAPPASMDIFNAPTRENCTVRRERTNTPLQALVTMNDPQFVEAARELAGRGMESTADFDAQVDYIATRLLARPLTLRERQIVRRSFEGFRAHYADSPADATALLNTGYRKPNPSLPPADYAAMTMLANQLLNLDEVLNQ
jgi:hypothetical protein